ncbi:phage tail protein (plasmid) [Vibrio metschnikovii]|uniref:phage tail protein n=1 Tax=Vibrio metschnikovii TaxID=28172 RepID=UPI00315D82ED
MNIDQQLAQAVKNLYLIAESAVPKASAMAINRVAQRAIVHSVKDTSKTVKVKQKNHQKKGHHFQGHAKKPVAYVRVSRADIPAISIDTARTQIKRKRGKMQVSRGSRDGRGRYLKRSISGNTSIVVGRHRFPTPFFSDLKWTLAHHAKNQRVSIPIKVCKVPIAVEITTAFQRNSQRLMKTDMPKELASAMQQQVRLIVRRGAARGN